MILPNTAKQISGSKDFIDIDGTVYTYVSNYKGHKTEKLIIKTPFYNKKTGYIYCSIYDNELRKCRARRLNRVVAETFIPNPQNLPVVGHKNNIKTDNRVENLYWTTYQENTQKAVNDGLMPQTSGREDSQSKPVNMYETTTNKLIGRFGSCREAAQETGLSLTTIHRQASYHRPVRTEYYFRYEDDQTAVVNQIIGKFDYDSDHLLATYYNTGDASRQNNVSDKMVSQHLRKGKPKYNYLGFYFAYLASK